MHRNTYLGMKTTEHHRREKEAEAVRWRLSQQARTTRERSTSDESETPAVPFLRIIALVITALAAALIALLPAALHKGSVGDPQSTVMYGQVTYGSERKSA
jgi:hypothetical protein